MKLCNKCGEVKPRSEFHKDKNRKDGLYCYCKLCAAKGQAKWYQANKEKRAAWYQDNKEKHAAYRAEWEKANKEKRAAYWAKWRKVNKEKAAASQAKWYQANKEKAAAYQVAYRKANPEKVAAREAAYRKANPEKRNATKAKRRAAKLEATPPWLTQHHLDQIEAVYRLAALMKRLGLGEFHVDHIVPLQGVEARGLHVPWNLQVLPASQNMAKHNKLTA